MAVDCVNLRYTHAWFVRCVHGKVLKKNQNGIKSISLFSSDKALAGKVSITKKNLVLILHFFGSMLYLTKRISFKLSFEFV